MLKPIYKFKIFTAYHENVDPYFFSDIHIN